MTSEKKESLKQEISIYVNRRNHTTLVELINDLSLTNNNPALIHSDLEEILVCLQELNATQEIVVLEYQLGTMPYKTKTMLFPKDTTFNMNDSII